MQDGQVHVTTQKALMSCAQLCLQMSVWSLSIAQSRPKVVIYTHHKRLLKSAIMTMDFHNDFVIFQDLYQHM